MKKIKKPFIVSNADIISNVNYEEMINYHNKLKSFLQLVQLAISKKIITEILFFEKTKF